MCILKGSARDKLRCDKPITDHQTDLNSPLHYSQTVASLNWIDFMCQQYKDPIEKVEK